MVQENTVCAAGENARNGEKLKEIKHILFVKDTEAKRMEYLDVVEGKEAYVYLSEISK